MTAAEGKIGSATVVSRKLSLEAGGSLLYHQLSELKSAHDFSRKQLVRGREVMPLVAAVHACDAPAVKLCIANGAKVDAPSNDGECLLTWVAKRGHAENDANIILKWLLEAGCDANGHTADDLLDSCAPP